VIGVIHIVFCTRIEHVTMFVRSVYFKVYEAFYFHFFILSQRMTSFIYVNTKSEAVKKTILSTSPVFHSLPFVAHITVNTFIDGEMSTTMSNSFIMENTTSFSAFVTRTYNIIRGNDVLFQIIFSKQVFHNNGPRFYFTFIFALFEGRKA